MAVHNSYYLIEAAKERESIVYSFLSTGKKDIVKAIEFRYVSELMNMPVYNLGFGDYNIDTDEICDQIISNNGDAYVVFNTVLRSIPCFFRHYPEALLLVQGSDDGIEFVANCRISCRKRCLEICKNRKRRIAAYRGYLNKHFESLSATYLFWGGSINADQQIIVEPFEKYKEYDSVFVKIK